VVRCVRGPRPEVGVAEESESEPVEEPDTVTVAVDVLLWPDALVAVKVTVYVPGCMYA